MSHENEHSEQFRGAVHLLVFERSVDLCVSAAVKVPYRERDFVTLVVALSRQISLVEPANLLIGRRRGVSVGGHVVSGWSLYARLSVVPSTRSEVDHCGLDIDGHVVGCEPVEERSDFVTVLERVSV